MSSCYSGKVSEWLTDRHEAQHCERVYLAVDSGGAGGGGGGGSGKRLGQKVAGVSPLMLLDSVLGTSAAVVRQILQTITTAAYQYQRQDNIAMHKLTALVSTLL
jgi:hypothetical protein